MKDFLKPLMEEQKDEADRLLEEAEQALVASEKMTRDQLGTDLDATVTNLMKRSKDEIADFLSDGKSDFDSETFLQNMLKCIADNNKDNKQPVASAKDNASAQSKKPIISSAAQKVAEASESLMSNYKKMYEAKKKKDASRNGEAADGPKMLTASAQMLKAVDQYEKKLPPVKGKGDKNVSKMSTPPAAHVKPTIMEGNSEICSPLDLTLAKCRLPMYVDGAQDSKSDSNVSESSPILISSGDSVGRNTIVIEDSPPASTDNEIVNFDSVTRNTIVIQDSPPASNEMHTTNESSQISTSLISRL